MSIAKRRPLLGKAAWLHSKPSDSWRRRARPSRQSRPNDGGPYDSAHMKAPLSMDWDKLKVFHAAAQAGSFTHAGEQLGQCRARYRRWSKNSAYRCFIVMRAA